MLLEGPYFSLEHSDWDSWLVLAGNYKPDTEEHFVHVSIDAHINEPLPDDFIALQGDMQRKSRYWWNSCDRGIYDQTAEDFVDLRADSGEDSYPSKEAVRSFFFGEVRSDDDYIHYQHTTNTAAVLARSDRGVVLQIKHRGDNDFRELLISTSSSYTNCYELQLIDDTAFVYKCELETEELAEGTYCVPRGQDLMRVDDGDSTQAPYGWLHYNGRLYKGIYHSEKELDIVSARYKDDQESPMGGYDMCHDERYPRYGIAFSMGGLFPLFIADMKAHEMSAVHLDRDHVPLIGVSNGRMGVWKYTQNYLEEKCKEQKKPDVQLVVTEIFEELDACIEGMNDAGNGDFDPAWY
ncbi:hypothetical protein CJU89_5157 [Yarrowia sp. B02]|nr:hypothetical protein CJU89_5157 [Yarrowia sp. B02]